MHGLGLAWQGLGIIKAISGGWGCWKLNFVQIIYALCLFDQIKAQILEEFSTILICQHIIIDLSKRVYLFLIGDKEKCY